MHTVKPTIVILSISYPEITGILKHKTGKEVSLTYKSEDTITAAYSASVEIPVLRKTISKDFSVDLKILEIKDNQLVVRIDAGSAGNIAIRAAKSFLLPRIPGLIDSGATDRRTFLFDLVKIEQLKPVLEQMDMNTLNICPDEIMIEATIKA